MRNTPTAYVRHRPCGTPVELQWMLKTDMTKEDVQNGNTHATIPFCPTCKRRVSVDELSSAGPYSAVWTGV